MQKEGGPLQVNQVRLGAVLSYVSMGLSTLISLIYTPIMLIGWAKRNTVFTGRWVPSSRTCCC